MQAEPKPSETDDTSPDAPTGLPLHMQMLSSMPQHRVHFLRVRACEAAAASEYQCLPFYKPISRLFGKVK